MKLRTQHHAIQSMEREALRSVDDIANQGSKLIGVMLEETLRTIQTLIIHEYKADFGRKRWNIVMAQKLGTLERIHHGMFSVLEDFRRESAKVVQEHLNSLYKDSCYRMAWMLDQTTPTHVRVKLPDSPLLREATGAKVYKGPAGENAWKVRWTQWVEAYGSSVAQNINLGAMNGSSMEDAAEEVEISKAGTPPANLWDALDRVYYSEAVAVQSMAAKDMTEVNPDMELVEIWMTREDANVCDDCDGNEGLTREEAIGTIPYHPRCNCYWRLVPATWAKLLRTGSAADKALADEMDAKGLVPSTMITRDANGKATASVIVNFDEWKKNAPLTISAAN